MFPDLLVDENVDFRIVQVLRNSGCNVFSVAESCPGISDQEVLELARKRKALVVTEDHDFGTWVFAHHEPSLGVILLRYRHSDYERIASSLIRVLQKYGKSLYGQFAVVTVAKVRLRRI